MNRQNSLACIVAAALTVTACARSPAPEAFPQAAADAWTERFAAHDAVGIAALYTTDAMLMPPDQAIVTGQAAIREFFTRTHPAGSPAVEFATVETRVFGDYAWRQGSFRVGGPADAPMSGKFVELWKKSDDNWLIHREIWNANEPRPAVPAKGAASGGETPGGSGGR